jgi:RNA polymerase sigma-70 factor, ECF subfamily
VPGATQTVEDLFTEATAACGPMLRRLAKGYEADPDPRRDLLQEIHIELWRSLRLFDRRCSLQTWVYRVAHNVGASHILRRRREAARLVSLEALETSPASVDGAAHADQQYRISLLFERIHRLKPLDRQIILLYLEGESASSIGEITGISAANVATKIHRIKKLLGEGGTHGPGA